jgi:hypothetical protein
MCRTRCPRACSGRPLSLLKTVNYRQSLRIFPCDRRTVGRHDHHSICSRFRALVPVSQPSVSGTQACRLATPADRLAAATPSPPPALFRRPGPMGVPLPSVAAGPQRLGNRQTGDSGEMASQGFAVLQSLGEGLRSAEAPRPQPIVVNTQYLSKVHCQRWIKSSDFCSSIPEFQALSA